VGVEQWKAAHDERTREEGQTVAGVKLEHHKAP
jgi:hypothetical protein